MESPAVRQLVDRQDITDQLVRYCSIMDSDDVSAVGTEIFTTGAVYEHLAPPRPTVLHGREAITEFLVTSRDLAETVVHTIGNVTISIDGDTAHVQWYGTGWHWFRNTAEHGPARPVDLIAIGRQNDVLQRTDEGWRVDHRAARALGFWFGPLADGVRSAVAESMGPPPPS